MDENEYNFDFEGNESWALLALLAMIGDKITIDEFTIEQMMAAAMNKKEADMNKLRLSSLYGECMHKEKDEDVKEHEPDGYRGLYGRSWDV